MLIVPICGLAPFEVAPMRGWSYLLVLRMEGWVLSVKRLKEYFAHLPATLLVELADYPAPYENP